MKCGYCNGTGEHVNDANRMTTCEFCGGTGEVEVVGDSVTDVCDKCGGTGFFCEMRMGDNCTLGSPCPHQKPLTNEEYIRTCSTEELAKLIYKIAVTDVLMDRFFTAEIVNAEIVNEHIGIKEAEAWLKEKHYG